MFMNESEFVKALFLELHVLLDFSAFMVSAALQKLVCPDCRYMSHVAIDLTDPLVQFCQKSAETADSQFFTVLTFCNTRETGPT